MAAYYGENDENAAVWLRELIRDGLIAPGDVDERDIRDVSPDDLRPYRQVHLFAGISGWSLALRLAGWADDSPVWTGSCPCQPWSSSGARGGESDPRHLWPEMFRLVRQRRPAIVFGEQVASDDGLRWLDLVFGDMEGADYACGAADLCAAGVGADHDRPRLYWAAHSAGERQPEPRLLRPDSGHRPACSFREADRLVDAVRREALPFLCRGHDGLPERLGRVACKGFGNAVVPQVAAAFIEAWMTA